MTDEEATEKLGAELAERTPPGGTWLLRGPMGSGKTAWARGFVRGLGGSPGSVSSPTYSVLHRYDTPAGAVYHLDLYRLGPLGAWGLGLEDCIGPGDRLLVEWPGGGPGQSSHSGQSGQPKPSRSRRSSRSNQCGTSCEDHEPCGTGETVLSAQSDQSVKPAKSAFPTRSGQSGPWPSDWVHTLELAYAQGGRIAKWGDVDESFI